MLKEQRSEVVSLLRIAAGRLGDAGAIERLRLPGWEPIQTGQSARAVRNAAAALNSDGETHVSLSDLGCLVQYIADMLED